jgi:hypothetical protein
MLEKMRDFSNSPVKLYHYPMAAAKIGTVPRERLRLRVRVGAGRSFHVADLRLFA